MKTTLYTLSLLSLALVGAPAHAAGDHYQGAYVYGGTGLTQIRSTTTPAVTRPFTRASESHVGAAYFVGVGYRFNPYFAVEGGYQGMNGEARRKAVGGIKRSASDVGGLVLLPIGTRLELFGKLAYGTTRHTFSPAPGSGLPTVTERRSGLTPSIGANVRFNDAWSLRMEATLPQSTSKAFNQNSGHERVRSNNWMLGVAYRF